MKKLLVIAGAGSALDLGMPSINDIDALFKIWALSEFPLASDPAKSIYSYLVSKIDAYFSASPTLCAKTKSNFESNLYSIFFLASVLSDSAHNNALCALLDIKTLPDHLSMGKSAVTDGGTMYQLGSSLVDKLLGEFRLRCTNIKHITELSAFIAILKNEFEIGIFTTNYDDAIIRADSSLSTGFDIKSGKFDPRSLNANYWNYCYHIHGSVHFDQKGSISDMHEIYWENDLNSNFKQNSLGRNSQSTMEGIELPTSVIVAGYAKLNQMQREPFNTYYSQFENAALTADAVLIAGYGFSDLHINRYLAKIFQNRKMPVVVIDYADQTTEVLAFRNDTWARNMCTALHLDMGEFASSIHEVPVPDTPESIKQANGFDIANNVSVWYGGFLNACQNAHLILDRLK